MKLVRPTRRSSFLEPTRWSNVQLESRTLVSHYIHGIILLCITWYTWSKLVLQTQRFSEESVLEEVSTHCDLDLVSVTPAWVADVTWHLPFRMKTLRPVGFYLMKMTWSPFCPSFPFMNSFNIFLALKQKVDSFSCHNWKVVLVQAPYRKHQALHLGGLLLGCFLCPPMQNLLSLIFVRFLNHTSVKKAG